MSRLNNAFLYGYVETAPRVNKNSDGEIVSAMCYIHVVRGLRDDHAGKKYMKHDYPLIVSKEKKVTAEMEQLKPYDIVLIKGQITTKFIDKPSYCPNCTDEDGNQTMNPSKGILMYINPVFIRKIKETNDKKEALQEIIYSREISDQAYVFGTLIKDPTYFKTTHGTIITQYQIAIDRKFRIRTDDPTIKTDWPYVKSYGEQALEDKLRLKKGSEVYIDGVVQARTVHRKTKCRCCGKIYPWEDNTLELVPYAVEYVSGYKTDEILEEEKGKRAEDLRQELFNFFEKDVVEEENLTEEIDKTTISNPDPTDN